MSGSRRSDSHWPAKLVDERLRARIGQHPPRLLLEHRRLVQLALRRQVEQLVVGNAAPEEERQARRQLEVADPIGAVPAAPPAGANSVRNRNDGLTRMRCSASSMPASKPPLGAALGVEVEQHLDVRVGDRPAIGAARQRRQNRLRAAGFVARPWPDDRRRRGDSSATSSAPPGLSGPMISSSRSAAPSRVSRSSVGPRPMYGFRNGLRKPSDTALGLHQERRANLVHAGLERHPHHPVVVELSSRQRGLIRDRVAVGVDALADARRRSRRLERPGARCSAPRPASPAA